MSFVNLLYRDVRQISVENFGSGSISVEPGPDENVVEGSINSADSSLLDAIQVRQDRDHLRIQLPKVLSGSANAHLRLGVPSGLSYNIASGSAEVTMSAEIARSRVVSGSGDISLGSATDLTSTTGSGDISILAVKGEAARVSTGSGDIRIDEAHCPVSAKSGSGEVLVKALHHSELRASSGSGDISVPSTSGSVDLRSASGSLTVGIADDLPAWLDLDSVSG
ncbi:MAG: DUF4097 family beta strand repeat protein, partial [Propionibacteriaceae bacterium]|nr:DUF4097 family beta strand repeat protein [Propionibacteriaceae bacterium]